MGYGRRNLPVTVLYEEVGGDGESVLVYAADAAINLVLVTIDFEPQGSERTRLTFRQEPFATPSARHGHGVGWAQVLDSFASFVTAPRTPS